MLLFEPTLSLGIMDVSTWHDSLLVEMGQLLNLGYLVAQNIEDPDILGKFQASWENFIESGQVWALGIGFVLGYMFRTFTGG